MQDAKAGTWKNPNLVRMESLVWGESGHRAPHFPPSQGSPLSSCSFGTLHGVPCVLEPDLQEPPGEAD